jgi:hypothetical protein
MVCRIGISETGLQGSRTHFPSGLRSDTPRLVATHRLPSASTVRRLILGEGRAEAGTRSKSCPVQRARPERVPTHRLPSGVSARCTTSRPGSARGSLGLARKCSKRPSGRRRVRPPAMVPNHRLPSGVAAMHQMVLLRSCGVLARL